MRTPTKSPTFMRAIVATVVSLFTVSGCFLLLLTVVIEQCRIDAENYQGEISSARLQTRVDVVSNGRRVEPGAYPPWQQVSETTFGFPLPVGKGEVVVSGTVTPGDADATKPRKALMLIRHVDAEGAVKAKIRLVLKFRRGRIKEFRRAIPALDIQAGDRLTAAVKLKGSDFTGANAFDLEVRYISDFDRVSMTRSLGLAAQQLLRGTPGLPISVGQRIPAGERQLLFEHLFGGPLDVAAGTLTVSGYFQPASDRSGGREARAPRQIQVLLRHLADNGEQLQRLNFRLDVDGTRLLERTLRSRRFDYRAGHRLQVLLKPVGGEINPEDNLALNFELS